jgi:hypothetical protein
MIYRRSLILGISASATAVTFFGAVWFCKRTEGGLSQSFLRKSCDENAELRLVIVDGWILRVEDLNMVPNAS